MQKFKHFAKKIMEAYQRGYQAVYETSLSYVMKMANAKAKAWKDKFGGDLKVYLSIALKEEMATRKQRLNALASV